MSDFPLQKITIYHKVENNVYERYVKNVSYRNTSMLNQNNYGFSSSDKAIIRIFDIDGFKETWDIQKGDVIVNSEVSDEIENDTPITELSSKYGKDNVHKVNSINILIFNDDDIEEINHIKLGCI